MNKSKKNSVKILVFIFIIATFFYYELYISYNKIIESNYTIESKKINENIKVVIISDLHDNNLDEKIISKINKISPDIILVLGDMINSDSSNSKTVTNLMKKLTLNYKVFYTLGNSEENYIETRNTDLLKDLKLCGVTVLEKRYIDITVNKENIRIGGMYNIDSNVDKNIRDDESYNFLCKFQDTDNYKIMMTHRPDSFIFGNGSEKWDIDLVVSGHTHGGQVRIPFKGGLYVGDQGWFPKYDKGLFDLNKIKILITSGLGSGKQKVPRFNNPPEVVNLKISNK